MPAFGIKLERASCTHADKEGVGGVAEQGDHGALAALPNTEGDRHTSGSKWHTSGFQTAPLMTTRRSRIMSGMASCLSSPLMRMSTPKDS